MSLPNIEHIVANAKAGKPDAQFLLSQISLQNRDITAMLHWLRKASESGHAEAIGALGQCFEKGQGVAPDMAVALEHYERSINAGSKISAFHKAQLLYKSRSGGDQAALIKQLLVDVAGTGFVPALRTIGYLAMQTESSRNLALACLRRAASQGDPVSSFNLGWCLKEGWCGEDGKREAAYWLQQAAKADYPLATSLLAPDESSGSEALKVPDDLALDDDFPLFPQASSDTPQELSTDPAIRVFENVLDPVDCAYLMFHSRPYLKRAAVIDPDGGSDGKLSKVRTNLSTYIPFELVDIICRYVELKIIGDVGEELACSEPMSILCYAPGEYYRPHFDFFNPRLDVSKDFMQDGGQRTASAVTYLIAPTAGGGTSFPELDLTAPARTGATLWFRNCFENGEVDKRSLHAGDTVEAGEKWVVTKWFREKPTKYLQL